MTEPAPKPRIPSLDEVPELPQRELVAAYEAVCGHTPHIRRRGWLWRRLAWRLQEREHGGLSRRARRRLKELVAEVELPTDDAHTVRGNVFRGTGRRRLPIGSAVEREWKGETVRVHVTESGFEWGGEVYRSLSAVARAVTGTAWNGWAFFGLAAKEKEGRQ